MNLPRNTNSLNLSSITIWITDKPDQRLNRRFRGGGEQHSIHLIHLTHFMHHSHKGKENRQGKKEKKEGRRTLLGSNSTKQPDRTPARTKRNDFPVGCTPQPPIMVPLRYGWVTWEIQVNMFRTVVWNCFGRSYFFVVLKKVGLRHWRKLWKFCLGKT